MEEIKRVIGKKILKLDPLELKQEIQKYQRVVIDLGAGDGKFAYEYAKSNTDALVIGIDANAKSMEETSHKANRKAAKGGLENCIFIWSSVEDLPQALSGIADEVYINFPWGSLLAGVVNATDEIVDKITMISKPGANIYIYLSYSEKYEPETITQLSLMDLESSSLDTWAQAYNRYNIEPVEYRKLSEAEKSNLLGSWPKRILSKRDRDVFLLHCTYKKRETPEGVSHKWS